MPIKLKVLVAAATLAMSAIAAQAATLPIVGGETRLALTGSLGGLSASGYGTTTEDMWGPYQEFTFGITGGEVDTDTDQSIIEHAGAGVTLSDGTNSASIADFVIDTAAGGIFGNVVGGPSDVLLFTLGHVFENGRITVQISDTLGSAIASIFGGTDPSGAKLGLATLDVQTVPVPAAGFLLLGGLGGLALFRRKSSS